MTARVKAFPRCGSAILAAAVAVTAAACTPDAEGSTPSSVVIQPGRPGEANTTVTPEDFEDTGDEPRWNDADVEFFTMMIDHHLQALEMSQLAPDRAEDEQVKALADRIYDTQGAEIHALVAWLEERDLPVPVDAEKLDGSGPRVPGSDTDHGTHDMPGMLTAEQLAALESATGAEFDRLFLQRMIEHHQGAVDMTVALLDDGVDERANEIATDMGAAQQAEIGRLEDILTTL